jgi:hypothetical protein
VSPRAALGDALLVTLATPATWPLALAAFLLRGGVVLVLLPIVVLPSPVSLGNVLGPALTTIVLSGVPVELILVVVLIAVGVIAWVVVGGLIAAAVETESARLVADQDDGHASGILDAPAIPGSVARRILAARLVAHVPTIVALIWGAARLVSVAYIELTSPTDVASPIVLRVVRGAPEVVAVVGLAWAAGEILGVLATRRIVFRGDGVLRALSGGLRTMIRYPFVILAGFWVPAIGLALVLVPSALAAALAWGAVRAAMGSATNPLGPTLAVMAFVAIWMAGLFLVAVTTAWRGAVWSVVARSLGWTSGGRPIVMG